MKERSDIALNGNYMTRTYISRRETIAMCPPIDIWPKVQSDAMTDKNREIFEQRCKAVERYLQGDSLSQIQNDTSIHIKRISKLTTRCLEIHPDGRIHGFRALIPGLTVKKYERKSSVKSSFVSDKGGLAGVFSQLLNKYPAIEIDLVKSIQKQQSNGIKIHEKKINAKALHNKFIKLLEEQGVKKNEWPFNVKYRGLRTIQKYLNEVLNLGFDKSVKNREEQVSIAHLAVGTGHNKFLNFEEPYDLLELDAYEIEAFFSSKFETPEGTTVDTHLDRIWHIVLIESMSGAILSYKTVYRAQVGADDVIDVLRNAVNTPTIQNLTIPGLIYPEKGGLPNEIFDECKGALWGVLMLDGALAHLSKAVHDRARKHLGFSINWGPVGHFERRPNIERYFATLSKDIFLRFPSTSGSNPLKGRAKDAEAKAQIYKIRADKVEELVAVHTANYNMTPNEGNSFNSPIEVLESFLFAEPRHFVLRKAPVKLGTSKILIPLLADCKVRGSRETGRRPYIQFKGAKYTNAVLSQTADLIDKTLRVELDEADATYCLAYLSNGAELGILKAQGHWGMSKHSLTTRKTINSLIAKKILVVSSQQDPVQIYLDYLSTLRKENKKLGKPVIKPRNATEATRVSKESGLPLKLTTSDQTFKNKGHSLLEIHNKKTTMMFKPMPDLSELMKK